MSRIFISEMEFFAFHGHYEQEKTAGSKFRIDLEMWTDTTKSQISDNLDDTINYQVAYTIVKSVMSNTKSNLLENIAENILNALYSEFPSLERARVSIRKMNPQMGGQIDSVGISVEK